MSRPCPGHHAVSHPPIIGYLCVSPPTKSKLEYTWVKNVMTDSRYNEGTSMYCLQIYLQKFFFFKILYKILAQGNSSENTLWINQNLLKFIHSFILSTYSTVHTITITSGLSSVMTF